MLALPRESNLGAIYIGNAINTVLMTFEVSQGFRYLGSNEFKADTKGLRSMVLLCLLSDTTGTAASFGAMYYYTIASWGNTAVLSKNSWLFNVYGFANGITILLVQIFMILKYLGLTLTTNVLISGFLWFTTLLGFLSLTCASVAEIIITNASGASMRRITATCASIQLTANVVDDLLLACLLTWRLFGFSYYRRSTKRMVHEVVKAAITTGALTTLVTFPQFYARTYSCSFFLALNSRARIRNQAGDSEIDDTFTPFDVTFKSESTASRV
ncbi:hypothetical protein B0H10DRAFT_316766 [Mycena sp. CBHHK59/15]|nr:hypothetical protein B0H10DRAFT_316766 [Mycena sp. CBHHK59/15]